MNAQELRSISGINQTTANVWSLQLNAAMQEFGITGRLGEAAFVATVLHESAKFTMLAENLNYSLDGLLTTFKKYFKDRNEAFQYARKPIAIANRVYANRMGNGDEASGDGWKYRGKCPIQITGKDNHIACGKALGLDLLNNPDLLLEIRNGSRASAWIFVKSGALDAANVDNFDHVCDIINRGHATYPVGDAIGWNDRLNYYKLAKNILA